MRTGGAASRCGWAWKAPASMRPPGRGQAARRRSRARARRSGAITQKACAWTRGWTRCGAGSKADGARRNRLVTLYFEHVDEAGHDHGPESREYADAVRAVDAAIGRLLAGIQRDGTRARTNIIVVSDHGMAEVAPGHAISVEDIAPPQIATAVIDGQVIGLEPLPGQRAAAEASVLGAHDHYDCWRKAELPARWQYGSHPRIPSIVCQMHAGWDALFPDKLAKRAHQGTRGSHGFDPALPSMRAVFLAQGPDLAQGRTLPGLDNVDVYALMTRLLGIAAAPNDGNPATLLPALRMQPAADAR